jgi:hypothetical protein
MNRRSMFTTFLLAALVLSFTYALPNHPAAAQDTGLTLNLEASTTKAKVGTFVGFTVQVENSGTGVIPAVSVNLGLPDALDARSVNCPGDNHGSVTFCDLGDLAPGASAEILFIVQLGARRPNGPVTAFAASGDTVLATDQIAPLKIVGPPHR